MTRKEPLNIYLKKARKKSGYSQGEVAKKLGVKTDRQFVRKILREERATKLEKKLNKPI